MDGVLGSNLEKLDSELIRGGLVCQVSGWLVHNTFVLVMKMPVHVGPCSSWWVTQGEVKVFAPLVRALGREVILVRLLFNSVLWGLASVTLWGMGELGSLRAGSTCSIAVCMRSSRVSRGTTFSRGCHSCQRRCWMVGRGEENSRNLSCASCKF